MKSYEVLSLRWVEITAIVTELASNNDFYGTTYASWLQKSLNNIVT